jgi:hypothetical protein
MMIGVFDKVGDLLDHVVLDSGIAVLGEGAAWVGRDRVAAMIYLLAEWASPELAAQRPLVRQQPPSGSRHRRELKRVLDASALPRRRPNGAPGLAIDGQSSDECAEQDGGRAAHISSR